MEFRLGALAAQATLVAGLLFPDIPRAYDFSRLDQLILDSLPAFGDSVVVMIKQGDSLIYHNRKGNLDSTTKIGIASASKWISGAVILRLAEKNLIKLDDSLGKYLPDFTTHGKGHITIREAFAMTSGLYGGRNFEINPLMTLQRSVDSIAVGTPMAFPAGTRFAYGGSGMQVVGRIAEIVTGKPWQQVAREEILDPCNMPNTTYDDFGLNPAIAGGIRTTAQEYLRFQAMVMGNGLYQGRRVLSPESIGEMFKDQTGNAPVHYSPFPDDLSAYPDGKPPQYGSGCWTMVTNPATGLEDEIASPGYYGSFPWADRCRNIHGMILVYNPGEGRRAHLVSFKLTDLARKAIGGCVTVGVDGKSGFPGGPRAGRFQLRIIGTHAHVVIGDPPPSETMLRGIDGRLWRGR
jgi:CubicO group peptidase (beta-lactamase class C family)